MKGVEIVTVYKTAANLVTVTSQKSVFIHSLLNRSSTYKVVQLEDKLIKSWYDIMLVLLYLPT